MNAALSLLSMSLLLAGQAGQRVTMNAYSFVPPAGYTASTNGEIKVYTKRDPKKKTSGTYYMYPAQPATAKVEAELAKAWKQHVESKYKVKLPAKTDSMSDEGISAAYAGAQATWNGKPITLFFTIILSKGSAVPILLECNNESYLEELEALIGSIEFAESKPTGATQPASGPARYTGSGQLADYTFSVPPGWTKSSTSQEIVLRNEDKIISMQPMVALKGDLETVAKTVFWQVFEGWEAWTDLGFDPNYGEVEKGQTYQGFETFAMKRYAQQKGDRENRIDAIVLLIRAGDRVAILSGSQAHQSIDNLAWIGLRRLLFDFGFKNASGGLDFTKRLLGSWESVSSSTGIMRTFHPNGVFDSVSAVSTRKERDATTDIITTKTYAGDGNYTLKGNLLEIKFNATGDTRKQLVRFYSIRDPNGKWLERMGTLDLGIASDNGLEWERDTSKR